MHGDEIDDDEDALHECAPPPPKRYRFAARAGAVSGGDKPEDADELLVTDTFVLELGEGRGRFLGLDDDGEDEAVEEEEERHGAGMQAMEVEAV